MERPWVFSREWLVSLDLRGRIDMADGVNFSGRTFAKMTLDAVVDRKVDGPGREVSKDGRPETTVEAADAVVLEDVFDGRWSIRG